MARILCITSCIPGILYPGVELARRLRRAGHHLTVASYGEAQPLVAKHGLDFLELAEDRHARFLAVDGQRSGLDRLRHWRARQTEALASLGVDDLAQRVRQQAPDLLLVDGELHEVVAALWGLGVPIVLLNSFVSIWRRPGLPPPHHPVRPGIGWRGSRPGIALAWWVLRQRKRLRSVVLALRQPGVDRWTLLRRLADQHPGDQGRSWRRAIDASQWLMPFTYRHLPVLSLHAQELEFPHTPPQQVCYTGPMVLEDRHDPPLEAADRQRLDALFERSADPERRLIYAGFGSFLSADPSLLRRLLDAVGQRPAWDLVLSLGGRADPQSLGPQPPGVEVFRWLPQLEVLRHAAGVVTHGGINTLDECILAGVPMLVYCGGETDMAGNTARIEHHGLGLVGDRHRDTAETMVGHLERLLDDRDLRLRVAAMGDHYRAYATERVAERCVDDLLARHAGRSNP